MATLPSGLETHDYGGQGFSATYDSDFQLLDTKLLSVMTSTKKLGEVALADEATTQADPVATTAEALTASFGTADQTIDDVTVAFSQTILNDNFASIADEINKLRADNIELRTILIATIDYCDALKAKTNALLANLRKTGGSGVIADNP